METNHKKGNNRKAFHVKKHRKLDDDTSFDPRSTNNDVKPVLFQLGSIASYGVSDVRLKTNPEITSSSSTSPSLSSSLSPTSSGDIRDDDAEETVSNLSFDSSRHNKDLLSLSLKLFELQGSSGNTPSSRLSGVTHASVDPVLMSPSVQVMDRAGSDQPDRASLPSLGNNLSTVSNDSLFSLSIGDNGIAREELFSYRDFKAGQVLESGELLSFCPSVHVHVPVDSSDLGKSFDLEDKENGTLRRDSENMLSNSNVSWTNIGECSNSDETTSSTQSFSYPLTKNKKKKKKNATKKTTQQQQQQQQQRQKKRCSWLCCCCRWPSCDYNFSCCKRLKCCSCCCHWSCCFSSSRKVIDDEMIRGSEDQKLQKESKTSHKWFCCFPSCS